MDDALNILLLESDKATINKVETALNVVNNNCITQNIKLKEELVQTLANKKYDLIISEYSINNLNYKEALQLLKENNSKAPFIIYSAENNENNIMEYLKNGVSDYIAKPNIEQLKITVQKYIYQNKLKKEPNSQNLEKNKSKLESLFDTAPDGILIVDKRGQIIDCNITQLTMGDYSKDELIGFPTTFFFSKKSNKAFQTLFSTLKEKGFAEAELEYKRKDGNTIVVWTKAKIIYNNENIDYIIIYNRDISELDSARKKLDAYAKKLNEKIKEINCLFDISQIVYSKEISPSFILKEIINIIPKAFKYPEIVCIKLELKNEIYKTANFRNLENKIYEKIIINDLEKGSLEAGYIASKYENMDVQFNEAEKNLLKNVAKQIAKYVENTEDELVREVINNIAEAGNKIIPSYEYYQIISEQLLQIFDTANFYICLYNKNTRTLKFPFMKDQKSKFTDIPAENTLCEWVIINNQSLLLNGDDVDKFCEQNKIKRIGAPSKCWLGVPLITNDNVIGTVVIQDYNNTNTFNFDTMQLLQFISNQVATTIKRKEFEKQIQKLSSAVEQSPASIIITDNKGKIEYVNSNYTKMTKYTLKEVKNTIHPILQHSKKRENEFTTIWETIKAGKIWRGRFYSKKKDGEYIWEDTSIGPIKNKLGKITHFIIIKEDISQIIESENEIKNISKKNAFILNSIPALLIVMDKDEQVVHWNKTAENIFDIKINKTEKKKFLELNLQWDWIEIIEGINTAKTEKKPVQLNDIKYNKTDGTPGFLNITINPFEGSEHLLDGFLIIGEDTTERKIIEGQLTQAQKLESIGQLAAGIAHEINTPGQFVSDNTHFLQDSFKDMQFLFNKIDDITKALQKDENYTQLYNELKQIIEDIDMEFLLEEIPVAINQSLDGIDRITKIVKAMKEFSHPGPKQKTNIDLNKSIKNTITVSKNEWKYVADVTTNFDDNLPTVNCFGDEMNQVVLNIIVNAAHAISEKQKDGDKKGTIHIETKTIDDKVEIRISDTGSGIPQKIIDKIFDPFFTTKEVGKGTGQGLSIAHSVITQKHDGEIQVESKPGEGTTFIIKLPL